MKPKIAVHLMLMVSIAPLLTGCLCMTAVANKCDKRTVDSSNPSAVYRKTASTNCFVLEGMRKNDLYHESEPFQAYLFVPEYLLVYDHLGENGMLSLEDIKKVQTRKSENFPSQELETTK